MQSDPAGTPGGLGARTRPFAIAAALGFGALFAGLTALFWLQTTTERHVCSVPQWALAAGEVGGVRVLPAIVLVLVAALGLAGRWIEARFLLLAVVGAGSAMYVARMLLQAFGADDDGGRISDFPSGHATASTAFAGALVILVFSLTRRAVIRALASGIAVLAVATMGASRVAAGAHTWLEVAGGVALGLSMLAVALLVAPPDGSRFPSRRQALRWLVALGSAGFLLLAALYDEDPLAWLDAKAAERVAESMPAWAETLARLFSAIGGVVGVTALCIAVLVVLARERAWLDLAFFAAVVAGTQLAVALLKSHFDRPRPDAGSVVPLPESASFPSGHATTGAAVFGAATVLAAERVRSRRARTCIWIAGILLGIAIGASRVVLNVHYVTDVLAGWCLGVAWLAACLLARDRLAARTGGI